MQYQSYFVFISYTDSNKIFRFVGVLLKILTIYSAIYLFLHLHCLITKRYYMLNLFMTQILLYIWLNLTQNERSFITVLHFLININENFIIEQIFTRHCLVCRFVYYCWHICLYLLWLRILHMLTSVPFLYIFTYYFCLLCSHNVVNIMEL